MRILYKREDGAVIVFDSQDGDYITAHIELPDGTKFEPKLLDNLISWGYWEPVLDGTDKAAPKTVFEPVDSDRLNRIVVAIDQNMSKREFGETYGALTDAEDDAWDEMFKEISYFASQGIAIEIPAEVPDVFDTGLRAANTVTIVKHLGGKHDQSSHGKGGAVAPLTAQGDIINAMNQQRTSEFLGSISDNEMTAIADYTSGSGDYGVVNMYHRDGADSLYPKELARAEEITGHLDSVIDKAPPLQSDMVTYRGIWGQEATTTFTSMKAGDTFTDKAFSSTSMNRRVAENFARSNQANGGVVLEIVNRKGSKGLFPLAARTPITSRFVTSVSENEWLLPRNSTFTVLGVEGKNVKVEVL